jgi:hypothetical protein
MVPRIFGLIENGQNPKGHFLSTSKFYNRRIPIKDKLNLSSWIPKEAKERKEMKAARC